MNTPTDAHGGDCRGAVAPVAAGLSAPIVLDTQDGEWLDVLGARVRILADGKATGGTCVIFEETEAPGMGPPLHRHGRDDEYFLVLEGRARFSLDGSELALGPGGFVAIPRGTVHTFCNDGTTPLRMLITCTPAGLEEPFRECHRLAAQGTVDKRAIVAAFRKFDLEIVGPPLAKRAESDDTSRRT